jgi:homoserine O-succinyltransferase
MDGIERRRASAKISGVFEFDQVAESPLTSGISQPIRAPHSRHHGLAEADLASKGYRVLTRSAAAGVDMFVREGRSLFVFLQGHPEYDGDSLLREYRRDFARFLRGEQAATPARPVGYFEPRIEHELETLTLTARRGKVSEGLAAWDEIVGGFAPAAVWRTNAVRMYRNWLELIAAGAARPQVDAVRLQRLQGAAE